MGPLLAHFSGWLFTAYLATLGLYAGLVSMMSLSIARRANAWNLTPWLPLIFATIHVGAGWGVVREAVAGLFRPADPRRPLFLESRRPSLAETERTAA
jgi:hypothetical protein